MSAVGLISAHAGSKVGCKPGSFTCASRCRLFRELGSAAFFTFQLIVGGNALVALGAPGTFGWIFWKLVDDGFIWIRFDARPLDLALSLDRRRRLFGIGVSRLSWPVAPRRSQQGSYFNVDADFIGYCIRSQRGSGRSNSSAHRLTGERPSTASAKARLKIAS